MPTLKILVGGFVLLGVIVGLARGSGWSHDKAASWFVTLWGIGCAVNSAVGLRAGYSFATEFAVFALTFGLPAAVAWWGFTHR